MHSAIRPRSLTIAILALILMLVSIGSAAALEGDQTWEGDFITADTGGQAFVEPMAVAPAALFDPESNTTFIAYQGPGLDPYVVSYDHDAPAAEAWNGPYRVAENNESTIVDNRDMHGAPALTMDAYGYLHIYFGAHATSLLHYVSPQPRDVTPQVSNSYWRAASTLSGKFTYPQPIDRDTEALRVTLRRDQFSKDTPWNGQWQIRTFDASSSPTAGSWETPYTTLVVDSLNEHMWQTPDTTTDYRRWYLNAEAAADGGAHAAMVALRDQTPDPYDRGEPFYVRLGDDGVIRTAAGVVVTITPSPDPNLWDGVEPDTSGPWIGDLRDAGAAVPIPAELGVYQNQITVAEDPSGDPALLFLSGTGKLVDGDYCYTWVFARYSSDTETWTVAPMESGVASEEPYCTDQFFDAASFEFLSDTEIVAYITSGGANEHIVDVTTNRGGDIVQLVSHDGGSTWSDTVVRAAAPLFGERYNDPQVVSGSADLGSLPWVAYCQWDNAGVNFVHKLYLADGTGTHVAKTVAPRFDRLSGLDRVSTSIAISQRSFPLGASWVVLADAENFPDALSGAPLANAYGAPILLVDNRGITEELAAELQRLHISGRSAVDSGVLILGGTAAVSESVEQQVAQALYTGEYNTRSDGSHYWSLAQYNAKIGRVFGSNRYMTACAIANKMAARKGYSEEYVLASGETFADALAISPVAAVNSWPILLTESSAVTTDTLEYIDAKDLEFGYIVGGSAAVTSAWDTVLGASHSDRIAGQNRYGTAFEIANFASSHGLRRERLTIASGESFPDALAGGVLAARTRGPLLLTPSQLSEEGELNSKLAILLGSSSSHALDWYLLGGEVAVSPEVASSIATYLGIPEP